MKGLHKSVEYVNKSASLHSLVDGDDFNILQLEGIAVNDTANATLIALVRSLQKSIEHSPKLRETKMKARY